jgi:hypothetical protein
MVAEEGHRALPQQSGIIQIKKLVEQMLAETFARLEFYTLRA